MNFISPSRFPRTSNPRRIRPAAVILLLTALAANADLISIPNASFESPESPVQTSKSPAILPGWVFDVQGGSQYGSMNFHSANFSSGGAASGNNYAFINNDYPGVTDTLTSAASLATIAPSTTYTLTVAIGNRNGTGLYDDPGNVSFSLLADGVPLATEEVANGTVPNGTFEDFTLTYETPASSSIIGEDLTIQLATLPEQGSAFQAGFDNVTLDETAIETVPEPATSIFLILGGTVLVGLTLLRRPNRRLFKAGLVGVSVIIAGWASVSAEPVDIPNASFETSSTGGGGWTYSDPDLISDWIFNAPAGSAYGQLFLGIGFTFLGSSSGSQCAFIENNSPGEEAFLTSVAALGTIAADTIYTLTVAVGNADLNNPNLSSGPIVFDPIADTSPGDVTLSLLANGETFASELVPAGSVTSGGWQDFTLSYTTTNCDPVVGEQLTVQLGTESGSEPSEQAAFDNVRLDASPSNDEGAGNGDGHNGGKLGTTPEPPSWGLLGLGLAALGWLSRWLRQSID